MDYLKAPIVKMKTYSKIEDNVNSIITAMENLFANYKVSIESFDCHTLPNFTTEINYGNSQAYGKLSTATRGIELGSISFKRLLFRYEGEVVAIGFIGNKTTENSNSVQLCYDNIRVTIGVTNNKDCNSSDAIRQVCDALDIDTFWDNYAYRGYTYKQRRAMCVGDISSDTYRFVEATTNINSKGDLNFGMSKINRMAAFIGVVSKEISSINKCKSSFNPKLLHLFALERVHDSLGKFYGEDNYEMEIISDGFNTHSGGLNVDWETVAIIKSEGKERVQISTSSTYKTDTNSWTNAKCTTRLLMGKESEINVPESEIKKYVCKNPNTFTGRAFNKFLKECSGSIKVEVEDSKITTFLNTCNLNIRKTDADYGSDYKMRVSGDTFTGDIVENLYIRDLIKIEVTCSSKLNSINCLEESTTIAINKLHSIFSYSKIQ